MLVTDVGQQQMNAARYFGFRRTRSVVTSGGLGTMGFGLPAAIGAKLGAPDREVVLFAGDGGLQMTIQELGTIFQSKIPVKIVLLNNSFLGMVRQWQELFYDRRYSFTEMVNPDFGLIARRAPRYRKSGSNKTKQRMEQEYIITVFSENKVGLLSQITTVFTCRDVNIESLTTSESALQGIHKFTIVVRTTPDQVDKLVRQVEKKIDVLKTFVYTPDEVVQQEIALYKVTRSRGVEQLVREHNVRILEIDEDYIVVEKTGHKADTQALFRLLQPYGVQQFVRSGTVAIIKSRRELLNEYLEEIDRLRAESDEEGSKSEK